VCHAYVAAPKLLGWPRAGATAAAPAARQLRAAFGWRARRDGACRVMAGRWRHIARTDSGVRRCAGCVEPRRRVVDNRHMPAPLAGYLELEAGGLNDRQRRGGAVVVMTAAARPRRAAHRARADSWQGPGARRGKSDGEERSSGGRVARRHRPSTSRFSACASAKLGDDKSRFPQGQRIPICLLWQWLGGQLSASGLSSCDLGVA
jgi:hypothetical protein